jgi:uncharacterized protein (DUF2249 family)
MVRNPKSIKMSKLIITPKTKIHDLLTAYPELEELLIAQAQPFEKLRNPLLRRTIGKVTTLSQAAALGGLKVEELVNLLRKEAGQSGISDFDDASRQYNTQQPSWYDEGKVVQTIDVREMLHAGEQPVHEVLAAVKKLKKEEILEIIAPFLPAPLVDKVTGLGHQHWIKDASGEEIHVYFCSSGV